MIAAAVFLGLGCGGGNGASVDAGTGGAMGGGSGGVAGPGNDAGEPGTGGDGRDSGPGTDNSATVLAQGEEQPTAIAVDATSLYWTTKTAVRRVPKTGGAAMTLFSSLDNPSELKADDASLYWLNKPGVKDVMAGAKTGGQATTLATGAGSGLIIDNESAYWVDNTASPNVLLRLSKMAGAVPTTIASQRALGIPADDDQFLYWAEGYMGRIQRVAKAGGTIMDLRAKDADTADLARLDTTDVYFVTYGQVAQSSTLQRIAKIGGPTTMLASGLDKPSDLAVTTDAIYWLTPGDSGTAGALIKLSKSNGNQLTKVSSQNPYRLALDAQHIYWTELGDSGFKNGRIVRIGR